MQRAAHDGAHALVAAVHARAAQLLDEQVDRVVARRDGEHALLGQEAHVVQHHRRVVLRVRARERVRVQERARPVLPAGSPGRRLEQNKSVARHVDLHRPRRSSSGKARALAPDA